MMAAFGGTAVLADIRMPVAPWRVTYELPHLGAVPRTDTQRMTSQTAGGTAAACSADAAGGAGGSGLARRHSDRCSSRVRRTVFHAPLVTRQGYITGALG
jgi:hypothetical protein